ncbi:MAG: 5'/3'-nucleotidase SurE [Gammaproteobacteria bacterium]|nr:5'/3'-nucleotidase SurE [Gammaproteobacteria bacterium]
MNILLSNDDGVYAKGLNVLADTLSELGTINIVAPDRNRSGASNSLTLSTPLRIRRLAANVVSVEGTPTDCVHLAITGLLKDQADMVVSGINEGANLGDDTLYSGTVAAAIEGRFLGLPAIAVSLVGTSFLYYETAAKVAKCLVSRLTHNKLPANTILNVNVPDVPYEELRGWEVTRLGKRHRSEPIIEQKDPRGHPVYWVGPAGPEQDAGPGTDFCAIREGKVSITPLQVDLTQYSAFEQLSAWVRGIE